MLIQLAIIIKRLNYARLDRIIMVIIINSFQLIIYTSVIILIAKLLFRTKRQTMDRIITTVHLVQIAILLKFSIYIKILGRKDKTRTCLSGLPLHRFKL